jgi:hypothetical protein
MKHLLIVLAVVALAGCGGDNRAKLTADLCASVFEAADAIEQGADPGKPCAGIKAAMAAVIFAQGYDYQPAADHLKALLAPEKQP